MAARSSWRGAITFGGFPINVAAYNVVRSKSADSFKSLCPCHKQPVNAPRVCSVDRSELDAATLLKGVEVSKGDVREVPADAVAQINDAERSAALDIEQLAPLDTVPLHLSLGHFALVPDPKVPGSDKPVQILWNGLRAGRALITEWVPRAGSRTQLVAVVADDAGLWLHVLPYATDLQDSGVEFEPVEDAQAAQMFETFATANGIDMGDFAHDAHADRYKERRDELVGKALNGEPITVESAPAAAAPVVDLMAAMQASLEEVKAKPKPRKKAAA